MSIVNIDPVTGREILLFDAFGYNGQYEVKATGFSGTVPANATTNLDFAIGNEDRYIQGIHLLLKNHAFGDTANLQVVDVDNVLGGGAGLVLKQFATNWSVNDQVQEQGANVFGYVAKIFAGLYIRIVYTSVAGFLSPAVQIKLNCLLHKKVA